MLRTLVFLLSFLFLAQGAFAQEVLSRDRVTISTSPAFPHATTPLSLSVQALSQPLEQAYIRWFVDGALIAEGEGLSRAFTTTKELGSKTTISVEVLGHDNVLLTDTRVIYPAEIDIVWESTAYVPPFYKGRQLASPGTLIKVEAVPRLVRGGSVVPVRDIVFTWRRNDAIVASASGRGKSTATFPAPELFGSDSISVEASSADGGLMAAAETVIPSQDPFVLLYQVHPLFGTLFNRALGSENNFSDVETTFTAIPFFAEASRPDDTRLEYAWSVNGAVIPSDTINPSRITINASDSSGAAKIALSITHASNYLMDAHGVWRLILGSGANVDTEGPFARPQ